MRHPKLAGSRLFGCKRRPYAARILGSRSPNDSATRAPNSERTDSGVHRPPDCGDVDPTWATGTSYIPFKSSSYTVPYRSRLLRLHSADEKRPMYVSAALSSTQHSATLGLGRYRKPSAWSSNFVAVACTQPLKLFRTGLVNAEVGDLKRQRKVSDPS